MRLPATGDFGMTLAKGFKVIKTELPALDTDDIGFVMKSMGMIMLEICGGATGSLWGTGFRAVGKYAKGKREVTLVDINKMMESFIKGMQKTGGAELGDKTLLDALIPASEALSSAVAIHMNIEEGWREATSAAAAGAEKTKSMVARKGRATYQGERSIGYPDAGAVAVSVLMQEVNALISK